MGTEACIDNIRSISDNALESTALEQIICLAGSLDIVAYPLTPFSDEAAGFLSSLSQLLMKDSLARTYPDVISFAFWCRGAQISAQKSIAQQSSFFAQRIGRGLAFHITPSNIPVNFAFSFAFSLLAGNSNIVRVPSKDFAQTRIICNAIQLLLPSHPEINKRCVFISYPADNVITAYFSTIANVRLIWGGDATIASLQAVKKSPRCVDILFSDRYSLALINGTPLSDSTEEELESLAKRFFNDTYLMDQNACSSPQLILWQNASVLDRQRFWKHIAAYTRKHYDLADQTALDKYVQLNKDIIEDRLKTTYPPNSFDGILMVVELRELPEDICNLRGYGGYFYEYCINDLVDLCPCITERIQTLIYYGYDPADLQRLVIENGLRGIDRIVPIGSALDIDIVWDGFDLVNELTRIVDVR